jgi:predicted  nucleic acid-binding Zn-ribbon protein
MAETNDSISGLGDSLNKLKNPIGTVAESIALMVAATDELNKNFVQSRVRVEEMNVAIAQSVAGVNRLGGSITDVVRTMEGIGAGARRNLIANEETISKIFAASQILGTDAKTLTEAFGQVGYDVSQVGVNLEKSITYIQSIGLNSKTVTADVLKNMDAMSKFNFNDGVQGLTRMAAQASMLRIDMKTTLDFADKLISPENAINTAAAFQRLGVAVGDLGDPLKLMNDALNDPGAIQDSLVNATKQFTYFDEKTQSFRINPQGLLTIRELSKETGIGAGELSKMALSAADLDKRLSSISPSLNFEREEDRTFLANLAVKQGNDYVVQIKNDQGEVELTKKLGEVTQEELKKLREQQDQAPKTLEDIQRSQLSVLQIINSDVKAILAAPSYGAASARQVTSNVEGFRRISTGLTGGLQRNLPQTGEIRGVVESTLESMKSLFDLKSQGKISVDDFSQKLKVFEDNLINKTKNVGPEALDTLKTVLKDASKSASGSSGLETEFRRFADTLTSVKVTKSGGTKIQSPTGEQKVQPITRSSIFGARDTQSSLQPTNVNSQINKTVDYTGTVTFKVDAPSGVSTQYLTEFLNSEKFKEMIYTYVEEKNKQKERSR